MAEPKTKFILEADISGLLGGLGKASDGLKSFTSTANAAGSGIAAGFVKGSLAVDALRAVFGKMQEAFSDMVDKTMAFEKAMTTLQYATGNGAQAMEFSRAVAKEFSLDLLTVAESYSKIAASAKGTSLEGTGVEKLFRSVSSAVKVLGLSADETKGVLNALGQMISKGNVQAEELRGQLGERLPGAFQIAARSMGVTTQALDKMLVDGKLMAEDFLPKFAVQLEKEFGASAKTTDTLQAAFTRLKNAWTELLLSGENGGAMKKVLDAITKAVDSIQESGFFRDLSAAGEVVANELSTGFEAVARFISDNKIDIKIILGDVKIIVLQVVGLLKDIVAINSLTNGWVGGLTLVSLALKVVGGSLSFIRDAVKLVAGAILGIGTAVAYVLIKPIETAIRQIGELKNLISAGSGDSYTAWADKAATVYQRLGAATKSMTKDVLAGKGAFADWMDTVNSAEVNLGATGNPKRSGPSGGGNPPAAAAAEKAKANKYAEELMRLEEERLKTALADTLDQREKNELAKIELDLAKDFLRIEKERKAGNLTRGEAAKLEEGLGEVARSAALAVREKYEEKRRQLDAKVKDAEIAEAKRHGAALLKLQEQQDDFAFQQGELTAAQVLARSAQREQTLYQQEKAELQARLALVGDDRLERIKINGEIQANEDRHQSALQAIRQREAQDYASGNMIGGLKSYLASAKQELSAWGDWIRGVMGGIENAFAAGVNGILSGQMTLSQGIQAIWKGIVSTIIQAVSQMIAKWIVMSLVKKALGVQDNAVDGGRTAASLTTAAAETWAAYAGIPFVGQGLALAQIALMMGSMAAVTGGAIAEGATVAAFAKGGLINAPTLALMGEAGNEIVAPESDFKDWARGMVNLGANLQGNVSAQLAQARGYDLYGSDLAGAASRNQASTGSSGGSGSSFPNAVIFTNNSAEMAKFLKSGLDTHGRMFG